MSQAIVEKEICSACGAEVRPQADYCWNCGNAVSVVLPETTLSASDKMEKDESISGKIIEEKVRAKESIEENSVVENPEKEIIVAAEKTKQETTESERKSEVRQEAPKLKSAAALRRESKNLEQKNVEIVWEEHENAPNGWFISVAILLTLIAAGILFLAMYLK